MTRRKVIGADGATVGHITDVIARPKGESGLPLVDHIVLAKRHASPISVPCSAVNLVQPHHIRLDADSDSFPSITAVPLADDAIFLVRDVLDTQVVDVAGQRVTRVADVVLARRHDGRLEAVGVEVGFDAVLRRLGLAWMAERVHNDAIAWTDLHLMSDRGHMVQLATPRSAIHRLDARALAALVTRLATRPAADVLAAKDATLVANVIRASHPADAERMLGAVPASNIADIIAAMPPGHAKRWRERLAHTPLQRRRHFLRFGVWPRRRHGPR